ncbi:hypothetical protein [Streptomyces rochei]
MSQSRAVAGSVVDGHSANSAVNGVSVSSPVRRRAYGQGGAVQV